MDIQIGKTYLNRTVRYLLPSFKLYGDAFRAKFNTVQTLAFGIHDTSLDGTIYDGQRLVFILLDKLVKPTMFASFMAWVKLQEYYTIDYAYDNLENGRKHMLVLTYPDKYADIYDKFIEGKYSKMYAKEEINAFFSVGREEARDVLTRSSVAGRLHLDQLNEMFNATVTLKDLLSEGGEYDFPPQHQEEIFNF